MAVDYYLKLDGITGEATDAQFKDAIPLDSFSWGETQPTSMGHNVAGAGAGKVVMQDLHFTTQFSKASTSLFLACASGQHIKKAQLFARKAGGKQETFLTVTFTECMVSSYQTGGSAHADIIPMDQVSLAFAKIEIEYKGQTATGSVANPVKVGYDLKLNQKV
jgi:type VI secretion system secreted protein Hcp